MQMKINIHSSICVPMDCQRRNIINAIQKYGCCISHWPWPK